MSPRILLTCVTILWHHVEGMRLLWGSFGRFRITALRRSLVVLQCVSELGEAYSDQATMTNILTTVFVCF